MVNAAQEKLPLLADPVAPSAKAATLLSRVPPHLQGVLMIATAALMASISSALVKFASYSMPSMETVFWRSFVTWALNLIGMRIYKVPLYADRQFWPALAARCFFGTLALSLLYYGMKHLVLADASVLAATGPVLTFFLGALVLRERIDLVYLCVGLLSFVGVMCVARPPWLFGEQADAAAAKTGSALAVVGCLVSAIATACSFVSMRRLEHLHFMIVINYFTLASTIVSLAPLLWQGTFVASMSLANWLAVLGVGLFSFVAQSLYTRGFQIEKVGVASIMTYLDVVFVFIWDSTLLREHINPWSFLGAAIVCSCSIMIVLRRAHRK